MLSATLSPAHLRGLVSRLEPESQKTYARDILGEDVASLPRRCFAFRPYDNNTFILPLKQSFIKNPRLMPGTRVMLALLSGWAGTSKPLHLTQAGIARHMSRSVRQVQRYLKDAQREGLLQISYRKNRMGMIIGMTIYLSFRQLRPFLKRRGPAKPRKAATTQMADTNTLVKDSSSLDPQKRAGLDQINASLERFRQSAGFGAL